MLFFIGQILPYIALAVFFGGIIVKVAIWLKKPVPFPQTLFPAPSSTAGRIADIMKEMVIFKSLCKGNKYLWLLAWLMHVALLMVIGGHLVGIPALTKQFTVLGFSAAESMAISAFLGTWAGLMLFAALVALLYRRTADPQIKRLSAPADYFDLLLLLAIVISGMHMRLTTHEADLLAIRTYLGGVLAFSPGQIPKDWIFVSHYFLVLILMIYFPFSKLIHLAGFFVNRALVNESAPVYPTVGIPAKLELQGLTRINCGEASRGGVSE